MPRRIGTRPRALEEGEIPDGFSGLLRGYVEQRRESPGRDGMLHLNAACPLIPPPRLPGGSPPRGKPAALAVVAYFARLFCGRMLDASQASAGPRRLATVSGSVGGTMSDRWEGIRAPHAHLATGRRSGTPRTPPPVRRGLELPRDGPGANSRAVDRRPEPSEAAERALVGPVLRELAS